MIDDNKPNHAAANKVVTRAASSWTIVVLGLMIAVGTSLASVFISVAVVRGMARSLHPDDSGSTTYFMSVFFFELVFMPAMMICLFILVLPFLYWLRKGSEAGPVSIVQLLAMLLAIEAAVITFLLIGMESFGLLFALHFGLTAICTLAGGLIMLKAININLDVASSSGSR